MRSVGAVCGPPTAVSSPILVLDAISPLRCTLQPSGCHSNYLAACNTHTHNSQGFLIFGIRFSLDLGSCMTRRTPKPDHPSPNHYRALSTCRSTIMTRTGYLAVTESKFCEALLLRFAKPNSIRHFLSFSNARMRSANSGRRANHPYCSLNRSMGRAGVPHTVCPRRITFPLGIPA